MHNITKLRMHPNQKKPTEVKLDSRYNWDNAKGALKDEIQGLLQSGIFESVDRQMFHRMKLYFVNNWYYQYNSMEHKDNNKYLIVHASRTARQRNVQMMACIEEIFQTHKIWLQNISRAYIQGHELQGDVYVRPAK